MKKNDLFIHNKPLPIFFIIASLFVWVVFIIFKPEPYQHRGRIRMYYLKGANIYPEEISRTLNRLVKQKTELDDSTKLHQLKDKIRQVWQKYAQVEITRFKSRLNKNPRALEKIKPALLLLCISKDAGLTTLRGHYDNLRITYGWCFSCADTISNYFKDNDWRLNELKKNEKFLDDIDAANLTYKDIESLLVEQGEKI